MIFLCFSTKTKNNKNNIKPLENGNHKLEFPYAK